MSGDFDEVLAMGSRMKITSGLLLAAVSIALTACSASPASPSPAATASLLPAVRFATPASVGMSGCRAQVQAWSATYGQPLSKVIAAELAALSTLAATSNPQQRTALFVSMGNTADQMFTSAQPPACDAALSHDWAALTTSMFGEAAAVSQGAQAYITSYKQMATAALASVNADIKAMAAS